ncbi:methyltransferase [Mesorhizobium sp. B2-4-13]|uniref:methyltransferase n=1 Tax=Mesorhizobium sp. B2-4-13 TaxID=2589936 RepID=UPI001151D8C9|nr:methyltransferase [Mesorhizobium sp. B2-4-13]TPK85724.1 methyltransferase [Mesorhizobium sp. B2-4-13]
MPNSVSIQSDLPGYGTGAPIDFGVAPSDTKGRMCAPVTFGRSRFTQAYDLLARHEELQFEQCVAIDGLEIEVHPNVLSPSLTTTSRFFAQTILDQNPHGSILEIGVGTGYCLTRIGVARPSTDLFGSDINPDAVAVARRNLVRNGLHGKIYESDLFEGFEGMSFDMILFNPPLLFGEPENRLELAIFDRQGMTIQRYLKSLRAFLAPAGRSMILSTDRNQRENNGPSFDEVLDGCGFRHSVVATLDRAFEVYSAHLVEV